MEQELSAGHLNIAHEMMRATSAGLEVHYSLDQRSPIRWVRRGLETRGRAVLDNYAIICVRSPRILR